MNEYFSRKLNKSLSKDDGAYTLIQNTNLLSFIRARMWVARRLDQINGFFLTWCDSINANLFIKPIIVLRGCDAENREKYRRTEKSMTFYKLFKS